MTHEETVTLLSAPLLKHRLIALAATALLLAGCASQKGEPTTQFDFGPAMPAASPAQTQAQSPAQAPIGAIVVTDITGSSALENERMFYRLSYADALQARSYANSRWTANPLQMMTQRMKTRIAQSGAMAVHAFDQRETLLGQGTLAAELSEQAPDLDTLLVAVGGGGLIGGIAAWYRGDVRVIGIEPEGAPTLAMAMDAGRPVDAPAGSIAADSLAPKRVGELMFPIAQQFVERVVKVTDDDIRKAQALLWSSLRIVAEPGGAAALSALVGGCYQPSPGERVGVVICGANTVITRG